MIPHSQTAVQLVGPDRLALNSAKPIPAPGPRQILAQVECVGLCASDMKLLHQFDRHARKTPVLAHLGADVLAGIPSYVPDGAPTVPGHEAVLRVVAVGAGVTTVVPGGRYLVQADFRDLRTANSNGAFGYNFEGGLQQWVLLDERVTVSATGESYLLPVPDERSASQLALVEPWACVEDAFAVRERRTLRAGGRLLLEVAPDFANNLAGIDLEPCSARLTIGASTVGFTPIRLDTPAGQRFDDIIYIGNDPARVELLFSLLAKDGLMLIATAGRKFGRRLTLPIGRVHYGNVRISATTSGRPADALAAIPVSGELRPGDHVNVVGAGGPMGVMAMVRAIAASRSGALVEGGVRSVARASALRERVEAVAAARGVRTRLFNPETDTPKGQVDYCFLMAPVPDLVDKAVADAADEGVINVFAGIPADVPVAIDLDAYAAKKLYLIGTSGSTMEDMRVVLGKVLDDRLDTNLSVAAVCGMAGAIAGLNAVRDKTIPGKIMVYPRLTDLPLLELPALAERYPSVGAKYEGGCWTRAAEAELLRIAG
ncbi:hypothetical protein LBMAG53_25800 [Planctomycetota bacterium]|nr:hypothetical protein LBMAG53_25800 [Planctomycetota bacterium]